MRFILPTEACKIHPLSVVCKICALSLLKVAHPLMLRAIAAAKKKNDRIDAKKICDCLRCDFLPECYRPRRRFANGGARCGIATCWFGRSSAWRQKSCNQQYFFGMPMVLGCILHHFKWLQWRSPACGN